MREPHLAKYAIEPNFKGIQFIDNILFIQQFQHSIYFFIRKGARRLFIIEHDFFFRSRAVINCFFIRATHNNSFIYDTCVCQRQDDEREEFLAPAPSLVFAYNIKVFIYQNVCAVRGGCVHVRERSAFASQRGELLIKYMMNLFCMRAFHTNAQKFVRLPRASLAD